LNKVRKIRIRIVLLTIVIILISIIIGCQTLDFKVILPDMKSEVEKVSQGKWSDDINLFQKGNTCGAHALMAFQFSLLGVKEDPYIIYGKIKEKLGNGYIYPWGLTRYLKTKGIKSKVNYLGFLTNSKRTIWLKNKINKNNPVIVIIGNSKYLHYISLLGYDENLFSVYDSLVKGDLNGIKAGNIDLIYADLLKKMNEASWNGIRLNLAISK